MTKLLKIWGKYSMTRSSDPPTEYYRTIPLYIIHLEVIDDIVYTMCAICHKCENDNFFNAFTGPWVFIKEHASSENKKGDLGGLYRMGVSDTYMWLLVKNGTLVSFSPFLCVNSFPVNTGMYFGLKGMGNPIVKVHVNGIGVIISVENKDGSICELSSTNRPTVLHLENRLIGLWPSLCKILPLSNGEKAWRNITQKLLDRQRIEHKMRPDGPFMTKLIERDQDFQNGENTKN